MIVAERRVLYRYQPGVDPPADADVVLVDSEDLRDTGQAVPAPAPAGFHQVTDDHGVAVFRRDVPNR